MATIDGNSQLPAKSERRVLDLDVSSPAVQALIAEIAAGCTRMAQATRQREWDCQRGRKHAG